MIMAEAPTGILIGGRLSQHGHFGGGMIKGYGQLSQGQREDLHDTSFFCPSQRQREQAGHPPFQEGPSGWLPR